MRPERCGPERCGPERCGPERCGPERCNFKKSGYIIGDGSTILPTNWQLIDGYLIGPGADLSGANLTGADLSGVDPSGVDPGVDLSNVKSGGTTGDGSTTLPTNWQLIDGYLIGPAADLTDAHPSGANLTGADLSGAYPGGADLTDAHLSGATLTAVTGAAKFNGFTILPADFDPLAAGWTWII